MSKAYMKNTKCANCNYDFGGAEGRVLEVANSVASYYNCPICSFSEAATAVETVQTRLSVADLENQLKTLLAKARTDGLTSTEIVAVLRSELEFEAELARAGRRILVQIIDLGFQEAAYVATTPYHSSRELLQNQAKH